MAIHYSFHRFNISVDNELWCHFNVQSTIIPELKYTWGVTEKQPYCLTLPGIYNSQPEAGAGGGT